MKVKFTSPITNQVVFGTIIDFTKKANCFTILGVDGDVYRLIQPNSDYNFGFILNEEGERKYAEKAIAVAEELDILDKTITK